MRNIKLGLITVFLFSLSGCGGGGSNGNRPATPDTLSPVVSGLSATVMNGNTVTLTATATDNVAVSGYCFKTTSAAPLASDACFQPDAQKSGVALTKGTTQYVWARDAAGNVSAALKGPCSTAGYAASDASSGSTVCMMTDKGELVLELDAMKAPISAANFLLYVNDGFYSNTIFHRVLSTFMIQAGGYTYSNPPGYQQKSPTYAPITLEKTSTTGLSNVKGTLAMARTSVANSATSQFFINVVDNLSLDAAKQPDGNGYAVFGKVISGLDVVDQIKLVPVVNNGGGEISQPTTPLFIQWAYQLK